MIKATILQVSSYQTLLEHLPFVILSLITSGVLMVWVYFISRGNRENRNLSKIILIVYAVALIIRILKWFHNFLPEEIHVFYWNFCFALQTLLGPLSNVYLYLQIDKDAELRKIDVLHIIPFFVLVTLSTQYNSMTWYPGQNTVLSIAAYWLLHGIAGVWMIRQYRTYITELEKQEQHWLYIFSIGNLMMSLSYMFYSGLDMVSDTIFSMVFLFSAFAFAIYYIQREIIVKTNIKKQTKLFINPELEKKFESFYINKQYLDPDLTLTSMAQLFEMPSYLLSQYLNEHFEQSFPDFINKLRIKEAAERLLHPNHSKLKISAIAHDCGFNTLSAFNTAFKKYQSTTPSEYRNQLTRGE